MRILSITYEYPPIGGGGSVVAAALNEAFVAEGDTVEVVTSAMEGLEREGEVGGVGIHRTACLRKVRHYTTTPEMLTTLWPAYRRAAELIERGRPDILHTHFVFPSGVIAWLLSRRYGIPYVVTAHGSDIPHYNPDRFRRLHILLRPFWRRIVRDAALVVSPSEFLAGLIRRQIDVPISVIPNGFASAWQTPRPKRNLVLVVSRLFPRKGVQYFLEAVKELGGDWEFVVAGDGPYLDALRRQAARLDAPVRFVGFVEKPALYELYQEARILVFPSLRDNFPMVLLEAMEAGCAVITTDAEGCAEVVGNAGIVVESGNSLQINIALRKLMAEPALCTEYSCRARERVELFRWPIIGARYRQAFRSVLQLEDTAASARLPVVSRSAESADARRGAS